MSRHAQWVGLGLAAVLLGPQVVASPSEVRPMAPLVVESPVEHAIGGTIRHYHPLRLDAGAWRIEVEQLGIDVVLELVGPSGAPEVRVDAPFDSQGTERLVFETDGSPRTLAIHPRDAVAASGHYRLLLTRAVDDPDLRAAEVALTAAGTAYARALAEGTAEPVVLAAEHLDRAVERLRLARAPRTLAEALHQRALVRRRLDQRDLATTDLVETLTRWNELGDRALEATAANDLGLLHRDRGDSESAGQLIRRAIDLYLAVGDTRNAILVRSNLCLLDLDRGALDAARQCYEQIVEPMRQAGARYHLANVLNSLGGLAFQQGEPDAALQRFGEALVLYRASGDLEGQATAVANRAALRRSLGDWQEALADYGRALALQRRTGDRRGEARTLNNLGHAYLMLGDTDRALGHFEQALPIRREVGHQSGEAVTLTNLGTVYQRQGNPAKALAFHRHALELRQELGRRRGEARTRIWIARDLRLLGDPAAAHQELGRALAAFESLQDRRYQAVALADRGRLELDTGRTAEARRDLEKALAMQLELGDPWSEANTRVALAELERVTGSIERALEQTGRVLDLVDTLRRGVGIPQLQATFVETRQRVGDLAIALAMERHRGEPGAGHDRIAFLTSERLRGRTLLDLLDRSGVTPYPAASTEQLARRRQLGDRLRLLADRRLVASSRADRATVETLDTAIAERAAEADRLEAELRATPSTRALPQRPLAIHWIQSLLGDRTMLLEIALGEPESFAWVLTASDFVSHRLPGRATLEGLAEQAHRELSTVELGVEVGGARSGFDSTPAVEALSRALLDPLVESLGLGSSRLESSDRQPRRLLVVADGALHSVPFVTLSLPGSLPAGEGLLLDRFAIAHLPSASALAPLRAAAFEHRDHRRQLAVLADPIFGGGDPRLSNPGSGRPSESPEPTLRDPVTASFPRLVGSRREAEAIGALFSSGERWLALGADAHRDALVGPEVASARIVHLATHALIEGDRPETSGLLLSRFDGEGRPIDGFFPLREVYGLRLQAETVVLSGCRTAQGRAFRGEGLVGLTHGFFRAGALRVVASLWRVDDTATALLMEHFYRALRVDGLDPVAALGSAQRALRAEPRFRDPYYWAAFVVQGEP